MPGLSPKLPLIVDKIDGPYVLTKTFMEATKQNFKNLLLTIPGERVMDANFGVGLVRFLFEQDADYLRGDIAANIENQVRMYMPHIKIIDMEFQNRDADPNIGNHMLSVKLIYRVEPFNEQDFLNISVE